MKKLLLLFIVLISVNESKSQAVFEIVSNSCDTNVVGTFLFEYAGELDGSSTDWGCPDITNPANAVQGCLVFINDGTPGTTNGANGIPPLDVPNYTLGCNSSSTQDLTGKIAVIYRGTCEFGLKAYNAQLRGAIGVIIINHTGAPTGMAGNTYGINVTIPVIQISRADGDVITACIDTVCNGVVGFIGNSMGYYQNNMSSSKADILLTESSAMPWDLARNGTEYPVDFGLWAYNKGTAPQIGVTATVDVVYNGNSVYTQTTAPVNFASPDTTFLDSNYFDLGTYAPALWNIGTYTITYTINNTNEQYFADNTFSFEFKLTNNDDIYAKCSLDNLNQPIHNTAYSLSQVTYPYDWETCIAFRNEYAGTKNAMATGMNFSSTAWFSLENQVIELRVYEWNDVFLDINSPETYNNLSLLENSVYTYVDNTLSDSNVYLAFNSPVSLQDNQRYLFCVYNNNDTLRIGFNTQLDYTTTQNFYLQPISPIGTRDIPNNTKTWFLNGFGLDAIPAISVKMDIATNVNGTTKESTFYPYPYPNPIANLLTVPVRKGVLGNVKVEVFDLTGKLVLSENQQIGNEPLKVNVASIKNGTYLFQLTFVDGTTDVFKISVNR